MKLLGRIKTLKDKVSKSVTPSYISPQLAEHLAGFNAKGASLENAKEGLKAAGWTAEEIDAALAKQPYSEPQPIQAYSSPSYTSYTEPQQSSKPVKVLLLVSLVLLGIFGIYYLVRLSFSTSATSGTISTLDCLKENGTISEFSSKVCQIGSVQLTVVDN
jgi:hypothetical protein